MIVVSDGGGAGAAPQAAVAPGLTASGGPFSGVPSPGGTPPSLEAGYSSGGLLQRSQEAFNKIGPAIGKTQAMLSSVNWSLAGGSWLSMLTGVWDSIVEQWSRLASFVGRAFQWWGDFGAVSKAGAALSELGTRVSKQSGVIGLSQLSGGDRWEGMTADRYKHAAPVQGAAMRAINVAHTRGVATGLARLVAALGKFQGVLVKILVTLMSDVAEMMLATGEKTIEAGEETAVGAAAGPAGAAVAAVLAAAKSVFSILKAFLSKITKAVSEFLNGEIELQGSAAAAVMDIKQRGAEDDAFPGGHWPVAVLS